ncbi:MULTISPECIES: TetR/AcrR family transcriptional regulator [unclassified Streptomyces]|uniref:TetR/AcrR family transcriptional regulator n=1 Tax=unclassified Streptomyces TaxID=2593676 RepID=UPI0036F7F312
MAKKTAAAAHVKQPEAAGPERGGRRERRIVRQEAALDAAFLLAEREGAGGLTMRRLSQQLDVDVTVLYRLFRDKDELLLALCERTLEMILDEIGEPSPEDPWQDTLRRIAEATWRVQTRFPAITVLTFARTTGGPAERRLVELQLATLARAGLCATDTVTFYRTFVDTTLGLCAHSAALSSLDPQTREKDTTTWARVYARLPEGEYPATHAHATQLREVDPKALYDTAVEAILSAVERATAEPSG